MIVASAILVLFSLFLFIIYFHCFDSFLCFATQGERLGLAISFVVCSIISVIVNSCIGYGNLFTLSLAFLIWSLTLVVQLNVPCSNSTLCDHVSLSFSLGFPLPLFLISLLCMVSILSVKYRLSQKQSTYV